MNSVNYGPRKWVVFFSQSGKEVADLAERVGRWPDLLVTNNRPNTIREIDPRIIPGTYAILSNRPTQEEYEDVLYGYEDSLITLHGWLRIVPESICNTYQIYNGHPGLITKYEFLKGKDPQEKAYNMGLRTSGSVIHKVSKGVDEGEVVDSYEVTIEGLELDEIFLKLRESSLYLWIKFLYKELLDEKNDSISRLFEYREEYNF